MKYKNLKTIAGCQANTIFNYNKNEDLEGVTLIEGDTIGHIFDIIDIVGIDNKEYFEKIIEKPKSIYDLKNGDIYYYINSKGSVLGCTWNNDSIDKDRLSNGIIYLTQQEAQKVLNKRIALQNIKKYCWENEIEIYEDFRRGKNNYCLYLDNNYKMYCNVQENHTRLFYFIFEKDRQIIIDNCKNELDILFDIN